MLDSLKSGTHVDFRQRYQGTYGFLLQDTRKILVYLSAVRDGLVAFEDINGTNYYVYQDSDHQFEFIPVTRGWFNTPTDAVYLHRVPERQWHRGISNTNTGVIHPTGTAQKLSQCVLDIKLLHDVFVDPLGTEYCFNLFLKGERTTCALSKHFLLTKQKVYFADQSVGRFDLSSSTIFLDTKIIEQELQDVIRRHGFPLSINKD